MAADIDNVKCDMVIVQSKVVQKVARQFITGNELPGKVDARNAGAGCWQE